jgi:hypothetical protein
MDPCHALRPRARVSFIIAPYQPDDHGMLRPLVPDQCHRGADDGQRCDLHVHHWRERKTGPEFRLLVMECRTHDIAFTLYPPGFVPYGRCAVAPVDLQGQPLHVAGEQGREATLSWEQTLYSAALDAARRQPWPRSNDGGQQLGCWRTQGRRIAQLGRIAGLTGEGDSPMVGPLGISLLGQREARTAYAQAKGYEQRGRAVRLIAVELQNASCDVLELMLAAGLGCGQWGSPLRWDAGTAQLRRVLPRARSP